ncbi:hypothetical protein ON010_g17609 [Phytophthora cinnamomi]|nr:hypothetical protein ON010_g17609 [Phytophthora cinnamomi]
MLAHQASLRHGVRGPSRRSCSVIAGMADLRAAGSVEAESAENLPGPVTLSALVVQHSGAGKHRWQMPV